MWGALKFGENKLISYYCSPESFLPTPTGINREFMCASTYIIMLVLCTLVLSLEYTVNPIIEYRLQYNHYCNRHSIIGFINPR